MASDKDPRNNAPPPPDPPKRFVTTHTPTGTATFSESLPETLPTYSIPGMLYYEAYKTVAAPVRLADEADIQAVQAGREDEKSISFPAPGQVMLRYCDWPPGGEAPLHRHESIDFGIVLHGELEAFMESGETRRMRVGDVLVQRNTLHGWRNPSETEWARAVYVIMGCPPTEVAGRKMKIDLGAFA